jgi:sporulation protein YlmC with PRC-barrel domain
VQVASPAAQAFSLAAMADKPIRDAGQEILGTLTDFLIDPRTGKVEFAVVPSGVDAAGETYRLIPAGTLELNTSAEGLRAKINPAQWHQVESIPDRQLRGSISLNPAQRQRLDQQFGATRYQDPRMQAMLVRTSELRGKTLQTRGNQLGVVQDVAIDVRHQMAAALVNATDSGQTFLVAFSQLQVGPPEQSSINTPLTAAHFKQAQTGMPTGLSSSPFGSTNPAGDAAATAVRHALDRDPALARANVQVVPETRIRLHGTVQDEQTRSNIERTAKEAVPGLAVDNHITVQGTNR